MKRMTGLFFALAAFLIATPIFSETLKSSPANLFHSILGKSQKAKSSFPSPLFKRSAMGLADTLEIVVLYVEFKAEQPEDNSSTTGNGTFNSAFDTSLSLDPGGFRKHRAYLEKHMEFARDYFEKVSRGRLVLTWRLFPNPDANGEIKTPYQLENRMAAYNPNRKEEEKRVVFFERKAQALMSFVAESIKKANVSSDDATNPFRLPPPTTSNTYRSYMIFHAGHNGLIDGGRLGQLGADTPNDIIDFFATPEDFLILKDLPDDITNNELAQKGDSLGVSVFNNQKINQIMVLSESASQDDINFGINGILVNQIARQIGMPDTWDRGTGFTQLGYFDMMDVGHLSLSGFVPVYPSAWIRYYMGWEEPVQARPSQTDFSEYVLNSPLLSDSANQNPTSVKIDLNEREYLLLENRQRSLDDSVTVYYSRQQDNNDNAFSIPDSIRVPVVFMDSLFLDSLCESGGGDCVPNPHQPKGIITGVSSYDAGLPSSGVLVWHVNDWFIEATARFGFINASDEDSKELVGINLVEADGDLSIGQEGKDQLGQSIFDFGSGSDMLPHVARHKNENGNWEVDTVRYITPYGHGNTNSWNDGKTHVVIEALIPADAKILESQNLVSGDSIINFNDTTLTIRVYWNQSQIVQLKNDWQWPIISTVNTHHQGLSFLKYNNGNIVLSASNGGYLEAFRNTGRGAVSAFDTLKLNQSYDSLKTLLPSGLNRDTLALPVYSLGSPSEPRLGTAVLNDSISCVLTTSGNLNLTQMFAEGLDSLGVWPNDTGYTKMTIAADGKLGPIVEGGWVWIVDKDNNLSAYSDSSALEIEINIPSLSYHSMAVLYDEGKQEPHIVLGARGGRVVLANIGSATANELTSGETFENSPEYFSVVSSDFDRDGKGDVLILGSLGSANILNQNGEAFPNFPRRFPRTTSIVDSLGRIEAFTQDPSPPAVSDINGDGHPDILFTGVNTVEAYQHTGAVVSGWPFKLEERQNVGMMYSTLTYPASVVRSTPLVFELDGETTVLVASPDGLIWALDKKGKPSKSSSYDESSAIANLSGIASTNKYDWPLSVGGLNFDTTDVPYIHLSLADIDGSGDLDLLAQTGTGGIYAWSLTGAKVGAGAQWVSSGADFTRQSFYDVSSLDPPETVNPVSVIRNFHLYPSPLEGSNVNIYLDIGAPARKARVRFYDLAGMVVKDQTIRDLPVAGEQSAIPVNLAHLGPDVYTAILEVWFEDGKVKKKSARLGVIR